MVTNIAISLLRFAVSEFTDLYPDLHSFAQVMDHLGVQIEAVDSNTPPQSQEFYDGTTFTGIKGSGQVSANELIELLCPKACLILEGFREAVRDERNYIQHLESEGSSAYFELHPYGQLLQRLAPDFKLLKPEDISQDLYFEHFS